MVTVEFIYYKHFEEEKISKFLVYAYFIDGETYQIEVFSDGNKYISGNFSIDYIRLGLNVNGVVLKQAFRVSDTELKKIMSIAKPLKFKKVSK